MNALDLLVDFTTLVSISVESMPTQDDNINTCTNPSHDAAAASSLTSHHSLPFEQCHSTPQAPKENIARQFSADPAPQQSISYIPDCKMSNTEYQTAPPPCLPHGNYTPHIFPPYPQEHPSAILPYPWPQRFVASPQWALYHEATSTFHSAPNAAHPAYPFEPPPPQQHHPSPFQLPFHTSIPPRSWPQTLHYPAEAFELPWNTTSAQFDHQMLHEYSAECTVSGTELNSG